MDRLSDRCDAAVDVDRLACGVGAVFGGEEQKLTAQLFQFAGTADRSPEGQELFCLAVDVHHFGREHARADGVDGDAVFRPFLSQTAGEVGHSALGGIVDQDRIVMGCDLSVHGSGVDDAAVMIFDHVLADLAGHQEVACQADVHDLFPVLQSQLCGRADFDGTGVVDQNIDLAESIDDLLNAVDDILFLRDVALYRKADTAGLFDFILQGIEFVDTSGESRDFGTVLGQCFGLSVAQTGGSAGDDGHTTCQIHVIFHS